MPDSIRQQILRRAVEAMGLDELAARLKAPAPLIQAWLAGHASMPDRKFVALTDALDKLARKQNESPAE